MANWTDPSTGATIYSGGDERLLAGLQGEWAQIDRARQNNLFQQWQAQQPQYAQMLSDVYNRTQSPYLSAFSASTYPPSATQWSASNLPTQRQDLSATLRMPTSPGQAPSYTGQNLKEQVPFLGAWSGSYPMALGQDYSAQVARPQTNYSGQVNTTPLGAFSVGARGAYTVDPTALSQLTGGATPEDVQRQVQEAYSTLGNLDLSNYGQSAAQSLSSEMARRGILGSTGATSKRIGLGNWQTVQGARLGAEGTLAGIQAGEATAAGRAGRLMSAEGLRQAEAADVRNLAFGEEDVRAARAAENLSALQAASNLQGQYVSGTNEAAQLAQNLALGAGQYQRQGVLDVEGLTQGRAQQAIQALQAQSGLSSEELARQLSAYQAALGGNIDYTRAYNEAVGQRFGMQGTLYDEAFQSAQADWQNRQSSDAANMQRWIAQRAATVEDQTRQSQQYWDAINYLTGQYQTLYGMAMPGSASLASAGAQMGEVAKNEAAASPWGDIFGAVGGWLGKRA
jgi:hypothetical protein